MIKYNIYLAKKDFYSNGYRILIKGKAYRVSESNEKYVIACEPIFAKNATVRFYVMYEAQFHANLRFFTRYKKQ